MREFNLRNYALLVNEALERYLPGSRENPPAIHEAMRYSVFAGGKRLRPALGYVSHEMFGGNPRDFSPAAAAIECIHTYSLIHDDLPSMDNDDLRRGKPTNHKVFGEAIAILAGDALLTLAFELMTNHLTDKFSSTRILQSTAELAIACGTYGLIGGQVVDLLSEGKEIAHPQQTLEYIHAHKTGALITAAIRCGGILAGATEDELLALTRYGSYLGLGFQIRDDILDCVGEEKSIGKTRGKDKASGKHTYVSVFGVDGAEQQVKRCLDACMSALEPLNDTAALRQIAHMCLNRNA
jgi:geranylgeranyl diphosphate synthase type II